MIGLIGVVGVLLAELHGIEEALWAPAYWWLRALASPAEALLHSVDSIGTPGASRLILESTAHCCFWHQYGADLHGDGAYRSLMRRRRHHEMGLL
jgi:hypothetical protein